MSTINGHAAVRCERCDKNGFQTAEELAAHLRDTRDGHAMERHRAQRAAAIAFGSPAVIEVMPPDTANAPHHVCPKCQTAIPCIWETAAMMDEQARLLKLGAAQVRAQALGQPWGAPRKNAAWTDQDVFSAWKAGLSVKAIATLYQAGQPTITRALKRVGAK